MKAHRLFPCLFPVLAVATLLPSASFAPNTPPREFGEDTPSSQGAVGGASAQPSMEDVLKRLEAAEKRAKKAEDKTAFLEAQLKKPAESDLLDVLFNRVANCGEMKKWERLIREKEQEKPDTDFFSNVVSVALNGGITQDGETVNERLQRQQAETQGAAASSPAPSADLEDFVQGLFGGPGKTDRSATDKVEAEILKGANRLFRR